MRNSDVARSNLLCAVLTGTLLGMMLLLPGLSMVIGGIKYPEMVFNPASAGALQYTIQRGISNVCVTKVSHLCC